MLKNKKNTYTPQFDTSSSQYRKNLGNLLWPVPSASPSPLPFPILKWHQRLATLESAEYCLPLTNPLLRPTRKATIVNSGNNLPEKGVILERNPFVDGKAGVFLQSINPPQITLPG